MTRKQYVWALLFTFGWFMGAGACVLAVMIHPSTIGWCALGTLALSGSFMTRAAVQFHLWQYDLAHPSYPPR